MAVETNKSTAITNATATPPVPVSANLQMGNVRASQGLAVVANLADIGSTYRLFRVRSSDRLESLRIYCADIGTTAAGDVGLYRTSPEGGAVVDADFWASAVSISGGALNGVDITFEATTAGGLITNAEKRIWEALALTADPFLEYDVVFTLTAASDAAGTVLFRALIVSGE
jgi:hypothetical protein